MICFLFISVISFDYNHMLKVSVELSSFFFSTVFLTSIIRNRNKALILVYHTFVFVVDWILCVNPEDISLLAHILHTHFLWSTDFPDTLWILSSGESPQGQLIGIFFVIVDQSTQEFFYAQLLFDLIKLCKLAPILPRGTDPTRE